MRVSPSSPQEPQTFEARHRWRLLKPDERPHVTWVVMGWLRKKTQDKTQIRSLQDATPLISNEVQSQIASGNVARTPVRFPYFALTFGFWNFFGVEPLERREARAVVPPVAFEATSGCVALSESRWWWQRWDSSRHHLVRNLSSDIVAGALSAGSLPALGGKSCGGCSNCCFFV